MLAYSYRPNSIAYMNSNTPKWSCIPYVLQVIT